MIKVVELVRESRNGDCPAVHAVDGALRLAQGEEVSARPGDRAGLPAG